MGSKQHWENVFLTKSSDEVSWYQQYPNTSMDYIESLNLPKNARIIDIGGGDSNLVDALLDKGYQNVSVLDISEAALERTKARLGKKGERVEYIVSDVIDFEPESEYDFWHDRAAFHFLTDLDSINKYVKIVYNGVAEYGNFLLGTFSEHGPLKCSGLNITQYSEATMKNTFAAGFEAVKCFTEIHTTPFNTTQNFQFCGFRKK